MLLHGSVAIVSEPKSTRMGHQVERRRHKHGRMRGSQLSEVHALSLMRPCGHMRSGIDSVIWSYDIDLERTEGTTVHVYCLFTGM